MLKSNKILVIGATSFAGSHLVNHALAKNIEVIGVSRSFEYDEIFLPYARARNRGDFQFHQIDIRDDMPSLQSLIANTKPEIIVDFAGQGMVAQSWELPEQWYETNIVAKSKLVNFLNNCDFLERYIKVSTPEVYGSMTGSTSENAPYNPSTPYSVSHAAIDMHLDAYFKQYNFPVIKARFANFYGPHQQLYRLAPKVFHSAIVGNVFNLDGGGTSVRAFIHAEDVVAGIMALVSGGKIGDTYHFSTDEFVTIKEFVEKAFEISGTEFSSLVKTSKERPGKDAAYLMNSDKSKIELNWKPNLSLEQGLDTVFRWVNDNIEQINKYPMQYVHKR